MWTKESPRELHCRRDRTIRYNESKCAEKYQRLNTSKNPPLECKDGPSYISSPMELYPY